MRESDFHPKNLGFVYNICPTIPYHECKPPTHQQLAILVAQERGEFKNISPIILPPIKKVSEYDQATRYTMRSLSDD